MTAPLKVSQLRGFRRRAQSLQCRLAQLANSPGCLSILVEFSASLARRSTDQTRRSQAGCHLCDQMIFKRSSTTTPRGSWSSVATAAPAYLPKKAEVCNQPVTARQSTENLTTSAGSKKRVVRSFSLNEQSTTRYFRTTLRKSRRKARSGTARSPLPRTT